MELKFTLQGDERDNYIDWVRILSDIGFNDRHSDIDLSSSPTLTLKNIIDPSSIYQTITSLRYSILNSKINTKK